MGTEPFTKIEHIVVLMLENRSFDHMLGFLEHPSTKFPRLEPNDSRFANPEDPTRPHANLVFVSDDAEEFLNPDPPHSHGSVINQLNVPPVGDARMNGFVAAYTRKADGQEEGIPVIHWARIWVAAALALAGASIMSVQLSRFGIWTLAMALVPAGLAIAVVVTISSIPGAPLKRSWLFGPTGGFVAINASGWGLSECVGRGPARYLLAGALVAAMSGLLWHKRKKHKSPPKITPNPGKQVMRCMKPNDRLPALAKLATEFAVCINWHCSVPGATWPNRNFVHAGTSDGTVDIEVDFYDDETIFDRLNDDEWRIYYDGLPQVSVFSRLWDSDRRRANWRELSEFEADVRDLPKYVFIEPCHDGPRSNSQHPGNSETRAKKDSSSDFKRGDQLIARIYEALRQDADVFEKSAFVVTYDEHGGFYDHCPPPRNAVKPKPLSGREERSWLGRLVAWFVAQPSVKTPFKFTMLGPRVPAVIVSPLIDKNTVDDSPYDHTSIPRTVRKRFAANTPELSKREGAANSFERLFTRATARTDVPNLARHTPPTEAFDVLAEDLVGPPESWRDDKYAAQLEDLAAKLDKEIPEEVEGEQFGVLEEGGPMTARVASRFSTWTRQARNT